MRRKPIVSLIGAFALTLAAPAWIVTAHGQEQGQAQPGQTQQQEQVQTDQQQNLMDKSVSDLKGMSVLNIEGKKLGDIAKVAQGPDNRIYGIVSVGGFLGIGTKHVALPLDEMNLQDNQLVLNRTVSKDELKQQATAYNEQDYRELSGEQRLAQVMGEPGQQQMSFQQLDRNQDGYISRDEAPPELSMNLSQYDRNNDQRLDRAEFAVFEQETQQQQPGPMEQQPGQQQQPGPMEQQPSQQQQPGGY